MPRKKGGRNKQGYVVCECIECKKLQWVQKKELRQNKPNCNRCGGALYRNRRRIAV